ncbi:phenylalanine 4-monooxygenase [Sphingomonas sp. NSE70-1]|uniref:Phenylalanine 4-monooxygenase n=1 Tax=Sphingomonas caseinilyticus TaxID=2908205 RepID=A0ABT0RUQ4_9SPHN|nr:phenylalanine 4-monooxygenase [Sphingomonas caseinilyticus]MCL6698573.1 phenylalanine 4-monooxygenase [Sphingomonas caseinilyticus]
MFREFEVTDLPATQDRCAVDWHVHLVPQNWDHFTADEHGVWDTLFARQVPYLGSRIVAPFLEGIPKLGLDRPGIPDLDRLNERLEAVSGWRCVSVSGLVPDDAFFAMLADRRFPIGNFIRSADSLDYLEEPDCFHDIFGHVPMLAHEPVARLMQAMGRLGVAAVANGQGETISRLYWHTVEFGLAREAGEVKILGAGLASSFGEAHFALEADAERPRFTLKDAARTAYRSDAFQPLYFVSDSLDQAAEELEALDLARLRALAG